MRKVNYLKGLMASLLLLLAVSTTTETQAQNTVGGHFGVVQPIITIFDGDVNDHFDPYTIGFPLGITVRKNEKFAFDAEFVPFITRNKTEVAGGDDIISDNVTFLVHPGLLWGIGEKLTFGTRLAYEIGGGRYGFTPILNKGFMIGDTNVFAELVVPVRMGSDVGLAVSGAIHFGVGF